MNSNKIDSNNLFFSVWRNKYINYVIWGWVKNDNGEYYERLFIKKRGYQELNNIKLFKDYNAMEVLKEKVFKGEYIHFPVSLKAKFFYHTRSFSKEFFKKFIDNYRFQLLCQRNLFLNIIVGRNVNALHVFLNEPSTLSKDSLPDLEYPKWEFQRHKSQLSDIAINIGYIPILECLLENNEISVTPGQTLYNNILVNTQLPIRSKRKVVAPPHEKSILDVYNFCIENKFFTLHDFDGTIIKYEISWFIKRGTAIVDDQNNSIYEIINNIKEYVEFDQSKSPLELFINLDLYETSVKKATSILNIYNYTVNPTTTEIANQLHIPNGIEDSNLKIKDCQNKSITIPLIKKFTDIISRDYKGNLKSIKFYYSYLVYTQQLELAIDLLNSNNDTENQYPIFEHSFLFCDLELLKLVRSENISLYITREIFKNVVAHSTVEEKIQYLEYLVSEEHTKKLTVHNWYSLYYSLTSSNQVELVQHLLNYHNDYFSDPVSEFSIKRFSSDTPLMVVGLDSIKLMFKYLIGYSKEIISRLITVYLYNSGYYVGDDLDIKYFDVIDWIINSTNSIDKGSTEFMDSLQCSNLSFPAHKIKILKYLNENGFSCTYNGLFKKVIKDKNIDYFKYLVENTNVSVDPSSTVLSESQWYEAKYYLELICSPASNGKSNEYLKRFPISSHPIIPNDKLLGYLVKINDWDKILEKLKYLYSQMYMDTIEKDKLVTDHWNILGDVLESSFDFFKIVITELFNYYNNYNPGPLLRYFLPLMEWLINHQHVTGLKFIFENYSPILKHLPINYLQDQLVKIAKEIHSMDLFDLFLNNVKLFPQKPTSTTITTTIKAKNIVKIVSELPEDSSFLFFLYYRFPNHNFSIPYKKQDDENETWKIDWIFKYILN